MKKIKGIILLITLTLVIAGICGCGKSKKASANPKDSASVRVGDEGLVVTYAEDFSKDYYSEDELEELVDAEVKEFNETYASDKANGVVKESLKIKDKKATLKLKFANVADYEIYSKNYVNSTRNAKMFYGTYSEAVAAGYSLGTTFTKVDDSTEMTIDDISKDESLCVFFTNEGISVSFDGDIVATGKYVKVKDGVATTSDKRENYIIYKK